MVGDSLIPIDQNTERLREIWASLLLSEAKAERGQEWKTSTLFAFPGQIENFGIGSPRF